MQVFFIVEDSKDEIKKIKVKVKELNNFSKDLRIIVEFDDQWAAYGEAQGLLAGYCGSLAIDCKLFPINFERWSGKWAFLIRILRIVLKHF
jgi:hypothetical protein